MNINDFRAPAAASMVSATTPSLSISVGRPDLQAFVRSFGDSFEAQILTVRRRREHYLVLPGIVADLEDEVHQRSLVPFISQEGEITLWPVTATPCSWRDSALDVAQQASESWVRILTDRDNESYVAKAAVGDLGDPKWPSFMTIDEMVEEAFKDRLITNLDHPVVKMLQGAGV